MSSSNPPSNGPILILGASRGLGFAVMEAALADGQQILGIARTLPRNHMELKTRFQERYSFICLDLEESINAAIVVRAVADLKARLSACLFAWGDFSAPGRLENVPEALLAREVAVNITSYLRMIGALLAYQKVDRFVFVGSRVASDPSPGAILYNCSKAAQLSMALTIRQEQQTVERPVSLVINPGLVDTDFTRAVRSNCSEEFASFYDKAFSASRFVPITDAARGLLRGCLGDFDRLHGSTVHLREQSHEHLRNH